MEVLCDNIIVARWLESSSGVHLEVHSDLLFIYQRKHWKKMQHEPRSVASDTRQFLLLLMHAASIKSPVNVEQPKGASPVKALPLSK